MLVKVPNSKGKIHDGRRLISIPLPPLESSRTKPEGVLNNFKEIFTFRKASKKERSPNQRQNEVRTKRNALIVSFSINLLICLLLYFIVIGKPIEASGPDLITATLADDSTKPEPAESELGGSSAKGVQIVEQTPPPSTPEPRVTQAALPEIIIPPTDLASFDTATYPTTQLSFSPSMESRQMIKRPVRQNSKDPFGEKNGKKGNGFGDSMAGFKNDAGGFFKGKSTGDGSDLALLLDVSGSMKQNSIAVANYVAEVYENATAVKVSGCSISKKNPALLNGIKKVKDLEKRTQLVFICDLRDPVDEVGIAHLRELLLGSHPAKTLHVISFYRSPNPLLMQLIQETGGSLKMMN